MYRVKAEAVSGSKVYAGGKWLQCIGNKRVSVGDHIWTDGRCVYGHNQEAQIPLIIAQIQEAIPIATDRLNYVFSKKRLQQLDERLLKKIIMVNDEKSKVYFLPHAAQDVGFYQYAYARYAGNDLHSEDYFAEGFFAANIKKGKLYSIFGYKDEIQIKSDNAIIHKISLKPLMEQATQTCPKPPDRYKPAYTNDQEDTAYLSVRHCFIEDDKNFHFIVRATVDKFTFKNDCPIIDGYTGDPGRYSFCNMNFSFNCIDGALSKKTLAKTIISLPAAEELDFTDLSPIISETVRLQDGYYYEVEKYLYSTAYQLYVYPKIKIFSPAGINIFTAIIAIETDFIAFSKVKGGYLFGVARTSPSFSYDSHLSPPGMLDSYIVFPNGVFFLPANQDGDNLSNWEILSKAPCMNQRFRPMQNYKNWNKRIQEIYLD